MHQWCSTCQAENCMKFGCPPPRTFYLDMYGTMGYECRYCGTRGWGPGTSPGMIYSYELGSVTLEMDGNMWCAKRDGFINLQESLAGFGATRLEAVKDLLTQEKAGE